MTPVSRPELEDQAWKKWNKDASEAMAKLVQGYAPGADVRLRDALYKAAMPFLLKLSQQKCAYCESVITASQPGDVEHYRPKGRIRDENGNIVTTVRCAPGSPHPGYWWLAYRWDNLLPSCTDCNRLRRHPQTAVAGGEDPGAAAAVGIAVGGKADYFAVTGVRAEMPEDSLVDEKATLLDPSKPGFNPDEHFEFTEDGFIKPKSQEAEYTCKLLGLNLRETLVAQRREAYLNAQFAWTRYFQSAPAVMGAPERARDILEVPRQQVNALWEGGKSYTAFTRKALQQCQQAGMRVGIHSKLPLDPLS
jgi:hypothetical protein